MKFLVDNALSPRLAEQLRACGHDATHVVDYGMGSAPDHDVLEKARADSRILLSADTDFGMLLTFSRAHDPSVILFRGLTNRRPDAQSATLVANLPVLAADLEAGSIVIVDEDRLRVRRLPIVEIR